jgi:hypothetical protein
MAGNLYYSKVPIFDANKRFALERKVSMKAMSLKYILGSVLAMVLLAALPARAGSGLIKITHSDTPYRGGYQSAPATVAQVKPAVNQAKASEIQVAVMAKSPVQPGARRSVFIRR